ncbi:hypothetical protein ABTL24_19635, partial [Acinetobacter baumannii]
GGASWATPIRRDGRDNAIAGVICQKPGVRRQARAAQAPHHSAMDWLLDLYHRHFDWRDLTLVMLSPLFMIAIAMEAWRFRKTG